MSRAASLRALYGRPSPLGFFNPADDPAGGWQESSGKTGDNAYPGSAPDWDSGFDPNNNSGGWQDFEPGDWDEGEDDDLLNSGADPLGPDGNLTDIANQVFPPNGWFPAGSGLPGGGAQSPMPGPAPAPGPKPAPAPAKSSMSSNTKLLLLGAAVIGGAYLIGRG